jgi:hypothetical protein
MCVLHQVGRVDRDLVKNLLLGYVTADNNKKLGVVDKMYR